MYKRMYQTFIEYQIIMDSWSYSEVRAYKSGRNQGIYYVEATLPKEHRKICGRKQDQKKLGRNLSDARRLATKKLKKEMSGIERN